MTGKEQENTVSKQSLPYPKLMIDTNNKVVFSMYKTDEGIVCVSTIDEYEVGCCYVLLETTFFEDYHGKVLLCND